ncbi:hypothetical protein BUZ28_01775 [Staphylococcus borealis]|nr:hypothetical protein BUZ28_01775 [Staphylococcus borealis]RIO71478.1 hypothetical protein BUZ17_03430 [Staphylococcus borealis]
MVLTQIKRGEWDRILLNSSSLSQLALLVEFLSEIPFVGAPPARVTRIEKSLIKAPSQFSQLLRICKIASLHYFCPRLHFINDYVSLR